MVENNSLEGCVNSRLEYTVGHGYGDCLVPAGPPLARIASERDDGRSTFFARRFHPRPIDERAGAGGTPLVRPEKGAEKKRAEKMDLKCEESMSMRPTTQEFHRSPTSATDS